jgi:hypothetical protein
VITITPSRNEKTMNAFRTRFRRLVPAALFSAAVALGAIGSPAIASAEGTWDIEEFDDCLAKYGQHAYEYCCLQSGGELTKGPLGKCVAPAPEAQGALETSTPKPPKVGVAVVPVQPPLVG